MSVEDFLNVNGRRLIVSYSAKRAYKDQQDCLKAIEKMRKNLQKWTALLDYLLMEDTKNTSNFKELLMWCLIQRKYMLLPHETGLKVFLYTQCTSKCGFLGQRFGSKMILEKLRISLIFKVCSRIIFGAKTKPEKYAL